MRVLLTGASGYLGQHLIRCCPDPVELFAARRQRSLPNLPRKSTPLKFDLEKFDPLVLDQYQPELIIHAAAITNVDTCEQQPELAAAVNSEAVRQLAEWAAAHQARFVFLSTDQVFSGEKSFYSESDPTGPVNVYGRTKLAAEQTVLQTSPGALIARSALIYGRSLPGRPSFTAGMLEQLQKGRPLQLFTDQYRTPVLADDLAQAVWELAFSGYTGIIHLGGAQRLSRFEMGRMICRIANLDTGLLIPVTMADLNLAAARPADVSLNIDLAQSLLSAPLKGFEEGIREVLRAG